MTRAPLVLTILVVGAAVVGTVALAGRRPAVPERRVAGRPIQVPEAGYVSSDTCRACHPSQYASWHRSYHRTMTQVATPDTIAASFDAVTVDAVPGSPMVLEQRGRELWADFEDPDPGTDRGQTPGQTPIRPRRIKRQVVMTTGSHNQQIYWYATGNSRVLGQLPAIWLTADRQWIPRRAAVMRPPGGSHVSETGAWNGICVACHTTNGQPQFDTPFGSAAIASQTADTRAAEFGIACESCHGPSDEHARANRNPLQRYTSHLTGRPDPTIIQPLRLPPARSSQVCGQCHSFWEFADQQSERHASARGLPYRPGHDLAATRFIVQPTRNLDTPTMKAFLESDAGFIRDIFWSDGMVRATGREYNGLIDSPCFKNATDPARTMSCFSCHTMHKTPDDGRAIGEWADDQIAPRSLGNGACLQCHQPVGPGFTPRGPALRQAQGTPSSSRGERAAPQEPVLAGIDVLAAEGFARLRGRRVGLLTNQTGQSRGGESTIDLLARAPDVKLVALFSPEHGIRGQLDDNVPTSRDEKTGLQVHSLYGETRRPTDAMLEGIDTLVVDLQDIGARFYTYPASLGYVMEEAARRKAAVVVLDRPNPIDGFDVEGPLQDATAIGFNGYLPMPVRHGLTLGELARLFNGEKQIGADLTVVPMKNWRRDDWFDDTGLRWANPSPNMRNMVAATVYPGIGAIEGTNISVGRGTDTPFEQLGAPWIDGAALAAALNASGVAGVRFYPVAFTPVPGAKLGGQVCHGVFVIVTDRDRLRPVRVGLQIAATLSRLYGAQFRLEDAVVLLGSKATIAKIRAGEDPAAIAASWAPDEAAWRLTRAKYLLY